MLDSIYASIIENSVVGQIVLDAEFNILVWNRTIASLSAIDKRKSIGKNILEIFPEIANTRIEKAIHLAINDGLAVFFSNSFNSSPLPLYGNKKHLPENLIEQSICISKLESSKKLCLIQVNDVTAHRAKERFLKQQTKELTKAKDNANIASKAKSEFLANMSHEIRTPLNAIIGFSNALMESAEVGKIPADVLDPLEKIKLSGELLSELINNVLDLSKIEAGKMEVTATSFSLKKVLSRFLSLYEPIAKKKGLRLESNHSPDVPDVIFSDEAKVNQILMNLIANAVKFTSTGKILVSISKKEERLLILVKDDGLGIEDDRLDAIFNSFEQAESSTTRRFGGTGLGLAITRKLTELLGGKIWVNSKIGAGSSFFVDLPLKEGDRSQVTNFPTKVKSVFTANYKILLVEDNEINQEMMKLIFSKLSLITHIANNGKEGVEKTLLLNPDLVFMDIHMPIMDGLEAVKILRSDERTKNVPIVALTADAFSEQRDYALLNGFNDYIVKPLKQDQLVIILNKYLKEEMDQ